MKSILTLLSVVCVASFGFTGCASSAKQCPPNKVCPMTQKACTSKTGCCAASAASCPKKKASSCCAASAPTCPLKKKAQQ